MYYTLSLLFVYFFIYAVIGWMCEVVYCSIPEKKFINRGFLNGPYCPIYGVGALIIITFLIPYVSDPILVFFIGIILTSTLEYITSWGMEKLFHAKWWDYSDHKFNINGRVCLLNSLLFGILCVVLMYLVHPIVNDLVKSFSPFLIQVAATVAAVIFISDLVESTRETVSFNKKLTSVYEATAELKDNLKEKGITTAHEVTAKVRDLRDDTLADAKDSAHQLIVSLTNRITETKKINRYSHRRIMNAFPKMAHQYHQNALELYKAYMDKNKAPKN
ncbi:putative ABC transporter permease [Acetobacterium woodii]|uniref:Putative membrane protein n=1 Tax=Acetobacterium woodii (strain ATCC 29683 / DSM 1030 / JCM 2381 / KCTC 1655 / WB1) TaxID=931626 RepID=H6LGR1_ACEWD|nr:putative ABC transporter permease [Acetobacterium woodii]AFA49575.1 putative membrane protein [Acetobacterium woodii DSM 1030]